MSERKKQNKALYILTHDFKYEGLILLFLAVVALVLGVLIINGTLTIHETAFVIGSYPILFAWILVILGAFSLVLSVWPFYKPSIGEMKRVSWPSRGHVIQDSITVFIFTLILSLFFLLTNFALRPLIDLFVKIGSSI